MIEVIDNFAPQDYFELIKNYVLSWDQEWFYQSNITGESFGKPGFGKHGFACNIVKNPNEFLDNYTAGLLTNLLVNIREMIKCKNILRSRLDMTVYTPGGMKCDPHVDNFDPHIATIFYLNNSDGNTVIYNELYSKIEDMDRELTVQKEIEPKENRLVIFDGMYIHTGHVPAYHNTRVILNSNFN
jgi:hypothetical protein